jgi:addiction module RelE/StbE family toxin
MAKVIWSPTALADLEALMEYIAKDSPLTAVRFGDRLIERVDQLALHPSSGSFVPEIEGKVYREIYQANYRIIYRVQGDAVYLVALRHAAKLLDVNGLN